MTAPIAKNRGVLNAIKNVDLNAARIPLVNTLAATLTHAEIAILKQQLDPHRGPQPPQGRYDEDTICDMTGPLLDRVVDVIRADGGNEHDLRALLENALNSVDHYWENFVV